MTTTETPTETPVPAAADKEVQKMKTRVRAMRMRTAVDLAARVKVQADGSRAIVRFAPVEIVEHWVLIFSFLALGVSGLLQRYAAVSVVGWSINTLFGGIESLRTIHHLAAIIFLMISGFHAARIFYNLFVWRQVGGMLPVMKDGYDLLDMFRYNLGMIKTRPKSDRYTVEEKLEYWALVWGTVVMGITGLMQWFPTITTRYLPGVAIPIARTAHSMEAVLALAAIATWHMYHTIVKERNRSIFNGLMSEHEMKENHLLEYERIMTAYEYIETLRGHPPKGLGTGTPNTLKTSSPVDESGTATH